MIKVRQVTKKDYDTLNRYSRNKGDDINFQRGVPLPDNPLILAIEENGWLIGYLGLDVNHTDKKVTMVKLNLIENLSIIKCQVEILRLVSLICSDYKFYVKKDLVCWSSMTQAYMEHNVIIEEYMQSKKRLV